MVLFLILGFLFLLPLVGTVLGALAGFVVGIFFGDTILGILSQLGVTGVAMWQVGAFLGFVGGYFRSAGASKSKS